MRHPNGTHAQTKKANFHRRCSALRRVLRSLLLRCANGRVHLLRFDVQGYASRICVSCIKRNCDGCYALLTLTVAGSHWKEDTHRRIDVCDDTRAFTRAMSMTSRNALFDIPSVQKASYFFRPGKQQYSGIYLGRTMEWIYLNFIYMLLGNMYFCTRRNNL